MHGQLQQFVGVEPVPDYPTRARVAGLNARYGADMAGGYGPGGRDVIGYDRGDPGRSFTGPFPVTVGPTQAIGAVSTSSNIYRTGTDSQDVPTVGAFDAAAFARQAIQ